MKPKRASGSKMSAAQPPAKKKGSKASKRSEGEMLEDDVVVEMDVDEEEGGLACDVDTCGDSCLLHYDPMRLKGGLSGLHRSCSGQAMGCPEAT